MLVHYDDPVVRTKQIPVCLEGGMLTPSYRVAKALVLSLALGQGLLCVCSRVFAAERLVGLQSAPSVAMALPWFAEEARLYAKHDLDFQLVYIASSGIVTAAMSGGSGNVAIVGGEGPIRA